MVLRYPSIFLHLQPFYGPQRPDPRDVSTGGPIGGRAAGEAFVGLHRPRPGPNGPASNLGGKSAVLPSFLLEYDRIANIYKTAQLIL